MNLGDAVPQPPWDLPRSCHPMYVLFCSVKPGTSDTRPRHGLAPEVGARVASLRCPILRSGPDQCIPKSAQLDRASCASSKKSLLKYRLAGYNYLVLD
jgi:hypothetical protein